MMVKRFIDTAMMILPVVYKSIYRNNLLAGDNDGYGIYCCNRGDVAGDLRFSNWLRKTWRSLMNTFYVVGAVVSLCLMVYLVVALLKAEDL